MCTTLYSLLTLTRYFGLGNYLATFLGGQMLALAMCTMCTASLLAPPRLAASLGERHTTHSIRMSEPTFGPQADPAASAAFAICAGGFTWLQLKIRASETARESRDAAEDAARATEASVLAGTASVQELQTLQRQAREARTAFDEARCVRVFGASLPLRVPDPRESARRREAEAAAERRGDQPQAQHPSAPPPLVPPPVRNGAIGFVLILQLALLALLSQDPIGAPSPEFGRMLDAGGEMVDRMEAKQTLR